MLFTISTIDENTVTEKWVLRHNPEWEIPFMTVTGSPHIWNWDFINGQLLQDGIPLTGHTITVEKEREITVEKEREITVEKEREITVEKERETTE